MTQTSNLSPGAVSRRTGEPCTQCGQLHRDCWGNQGCNAHLSLEPTRACRKVCVVGAEVCTTHGGSLVQVRAAADRRIAWEKASGSVAALLEECDLPEQHPLDGLLEVVRHSGAMMRMLGILVAQLEATDRNGNHRYGLDSIVGFDVNMEQAESVWTKMYGMWADRYARACKLALDANIDERLVRNAEATGNTFLRVIEKGLREAGLNTQQQEKFNQVVARELRSITAPPDLRATLGV